MTFNKAWTVSALALACAQVHAIDFTTQDGLVGKFSGVLTLGTQVRTANPSPDAYALRPSASVPGLTPGRLAGQNGGSDLNFFKGDQISTVLKAMVDLDLKKDKVGLFVRASAWHDFAQGQQNVSYGNFPNGFVPNTPLSDQGFSSTSQFSNAALRDYFVYGATPLEGGKTLDARLGRQVLNWGGSRLLGGGIGAAINPADSPSALRPGAQMAEGRLPLGMLSAKLASKGGWQLEGFAAYEHRGNVYPGCGTYFDVTSFVAQGCNMIALPSTFSERALLASNNYIHRNPDLSPSNKHLGLALGFKPDGLDADIRLYAMNTTSVAPSFRLTVNSTVANSTANTSYALLYPENVTVLGASASKKFNPAVTGYGELAYRPNQPITFSAADLLTAFVGRNPSSLLAQRKGITGIPVGGTFDAHDRFGVVTGSLGASTAFAKALAADVVIVTTEVGFSRINSLPSPDVLRFGRSTAYGAAAYAGGPATCTDAVPGKTCTYDGYTTQSAWGVRLIASATYREALAGATLTPSLLLAKDVRGYSHDGVFSQGRASLRPGLRVDWARQYFAEVQYNRFMGGKYNLLLDRDYVAAVGGMRF